MRNKILVLVLALVCLFAASALAANHEHVKSRLVEAVAPTCTADGKQIWYCEGCDKNITYTAKDDASLKKTNHSDYTLIEKDATCVDKAYTAKQCNVCGTVYGKLVDEYSVLADHNYQNDELKVISIATCTQEGLTVQSRTCTVCNAADPKNPSIETVTPKLSHTKGEYNLKSLFADKYAPIVPAKTNANGVAYVDVAEGVKSTVIPAITSVDAKGNVTVIVGEIVFNYVPATCEADGSITISCENCDASIQYAEKALNHKNRDYGTHGMPDVKDCTKTYNIAYRCNDCGKDFEEVIGAYSSHKFSKEPGSYIQYINNGMIKVNYWYDNIAGEGEEENWVLGTWNGVEFVEAAPSKCATYYEVYHCEHYIEGADRWCECTKVKEVAPSTTAEHKAPAKTSDYYKYEAATCGKSGFAMYECEACGNTISETLKQKTTHTVAKWNIDVPATCGQDGTASATCSVCKTPLTKTIPALAHKLDVVVKEVAATGCVAGSKIMGCANCDATETITIAAPHNEGTLTRDQMIHFVEPTCSKTGEEVFECVDCGHVVTRVLEKLPHKLEVVNTTLYPATCCTAAYYLKECTICGAVEPVYVGNALGHVALTKAELAEIRDLAVEGKLDRTLYTVSGSIDCTNGATGTKLCKNTYTVYTLKNGSYVKETKTCTYEYTFELAAYGHDWDMPEYDAKTGAYVAKCLNEGCEETKTTEMVKPEYKVELDGTKGSVKLVNEQATRLTEAWVRISYGFELSDGSYLAMTTCMPITFDEEGNGSFSFFALNTSLESTGVNIMVVDQYDAMFKTVGQLVGNNYGVGIF